MFNAERLLGKVVQGMIGSTDGNRRSLLDSLSSGAGLMTAIGLGVGAFEILQNKSQGQAAAPPTPPGAAGAPPPVSGSASAAPPPPPQATPEPPSAPGGLNTAELAIRMIQVMIAAAYADGNMDMQEEKAVLEKMGSEQLSREELTFLLGEIHSPKSVEVLTDGITDPATAQSMYTLAVSAIVIDTEAERAWLDTLAEKLRIGKAMQDFIEKRN